MHPNSISRNVLSRRVTWQGFCEAGLWSGLAGSWLGLLGSWHWLADLCTHFRWQAFVVCGVAIVWSLGCWRRVLLGASLLTLALNCWLLPKVPASAPPSVLAPDFKIRVVSLNVLTSNQDYASVLSFLQQADADVLFLMEVDQTWETALQPLLKTHPHHLVHPQSDNFGIACYCRLPVEQMSLLTGAKLIPGDSSGLISDSIEVQLISAGKAWTFLGVHPVPPMGRAYHNARDAQLLALGQHIARSTRPVLITGDLNTTPWSSGYRALVQGTTLELSPGYWQPSWKVGSLLGIPIDLALATPPLSLRSRGIGPDVGSDHRAQILELAWVGNK